MIDAYKHKGLRRKLVDEIKKKGINNKTVLEAINKVPRHLFMESGFIDFAYKDKAFPIGSGQTISQPYTVAFQTSLLDIKPGDKVLEIGTGSGYQTAVLLELGAKVFTIERQKELFNKSQLLLSKLGYKPHFFYGDGYIGQPSYGPYDKILITAGAPYVSDELKNQLKINGKIIVPIGSGKIQEMHLLQKINDQEFDIKKYGNFSFVPMLKGEAK